jgi:triacylglycerol lipase
MTAIFIFVILAGFLIVWSALFTYSLFWYENAWKMRCRPNGCAGIKSKILYGLLSSIFSVTVITLTYPLGLFRSLREPRKIAEHLPLIFLVHGLYHNASAWLLFKSRLEKAGFNNIFIMNYGSFSTSFEKILVKLKQFVVRAKSAVPGQPVYIIGHSLGGLLARVYAERAQGEDIPDKVITLGSPHQGSKIAAFGLGKLAYSLIYRGPLFEEIESGPAKLPCTGIAFLSPVDNMVLPSEALKIPYPGWVYYETSPISHTSMLYSRSTVKKVIKILQDDDTM